MERIASDLTKLIGNTPLLELSRYGATVQAGARLLAKLECFNPCSSAKDRVGSVSYTHIDVYKRQVYQFLVMITIDIIHNHSGENI